MQTLADACAASRRKYGDLVSRQPGKTAAVIRLLALRSAALLLRPVAILLEGSLVREGYVLVLVLPIVAMVLTISSIPVHVDYFRSHPGETGYKAAAAQYISALTVLTLVSLFVLAPLLVLLPLGLSWTLVAAVCFAFVTEKLADETSRALEFRKAFVKWFLAQSLRSGWLFIPIAASVLGLHYESAFLFSAIVATGAMSFVFWRTTGLLPALSGRGAALVRSKAVYLVGSFLPATYRQVPRILVARLFPDQAHVFLAIAQVCQGVSLLFNVRFQIPYRKLIARRTLVFERRLRRTMFRISVSVTLVALVYMMLAFAGVAAESRGIGLAVILTPLLIADSLAFVILSSYLGYIPWFVGNRRALETYLICFAPVAVAATLFLALNLSKHVSLLSVPAAAVLVAMAWLLVVTARHFGANARHT